MSVRARTALTFGALAMCAVSSACFTAQAQLPGTLRGDLGKDDVERVGTLEVEVKHTYFIHGLVGAPPATLLEDPIKRQVQAKGADGVANLVYESQQTCGDVAWGTCTLGCITPRTYRLKGDIIRIRAERLPGRPAKLVDNAPHETRRVAQAY